MQIIILSHEPPLSKDEFIGYTGLLTLICDLTEKHQNNHSKIAVELSRHLNRHLSQLENEVIQCFINGIESES